ncbi:MAG: phosphonate metabolism protein/1,5-bisphosphokinase (PRPP-forming) PhnN [Alphaproteobacteria bacterium]|nr:phosphonate metabolism protein/1,5-bisphosphokinase (PRPP-forming) PhnN [Alphaproteobacteria bacterium]MCY4231258.1 phosphonate metabolism protein/1,5-bisphosphokinase (PRPP-forming) PhnN [Alphaproteobacteria bacterium]
MPSGKLILVVGPSGAGKDSLIKGAAVELRGDGQFVFAQRHITRPHDPKHEDHIEVSLADFWALADKGAFFLHWQAHGLSYGLHHALLEDVRRGKSVIANASRTIIDEARQLPCKVFVINVTAPDSVLAKRLVGRGRESTNDVWKRLKRRVALDSSHIFEIHNDSSLQEGISAFVGLLRRLTDPKSPNRGYTVSTRASELVQQRPGPRPYR